MITELDIPEDCSALEYNAQDFLFMCFYCTSKDGELENLRKHSCERNDGMPFRFILRKRASCYKCNLVGTDIYDVPIHFTDHHNGEACVAIDVKFPQKCICCEEQFETQDKFIEHFLECLQHTTKPQKGKCTYSPDQSQLLQLTENNFEKLLKQLGNGLFLFDYFQCYKLLGKDTREFKLEEKRELIKYIYEKLTAMSEIEWECPECPQKVLETRELFSHHVNFKHKTIQPSCEISEKSYQKFLNIELVFNNGLAVNLRDFKSNESRYIGMGFIREEMKALLNPQP